MTNFSFEFFPPKTDKMADQLWSAVPELVKCAPKFMSVTYGAGGGTRDGTLDTIARMQKTDIPIAMHLTYINTPIDEMNAFADEIWDRGIKHIVALRGDMPDDLQWPLDTDTDYFQYTSDFVEGLLARHPFEISVGAYPEKHPDAPSLDADLIALQKKCDAGATRAITQFFFDNDILYNFIEQAQKMGISTPIVPGILPIHDFKAMKNFAARCQTTIPEWLDEKFAGLEDKPEDALKVSQELLNAQVEDLIKNNVEHIHFYTLNKHQLVGDICSKL
ncbi:MAG: methylenetetrahydrofolate reductase [NAD(P)H] [Bdellovibrionales bacterium]